MRCPSWPTCRWRSSATSCSTTSGPGAPTTTSPFSPCAAAPGTPSGRAEHVDGLTYTNVLPVAEETVLFLSRLLAAERRRRGTRSRRRALGCYRQAVLVLRWFLDGTPLVQLTADTRIGRSTAYSCLHECIDALAARSPGLRGALLAARAAGHTH